MLDTLMALWNQGARGRGIMAATAFFIICISISLLLISAENSWTSWLSRQGNSPGDQSSITRTTDPTATARSNASLAASDPTPTTSAPTATATPAVKVRITATPMTAALPCATSIAHTMPVRPTATTPQRKARPTPDPTAGRRITPTPELTASPSATATPTPTPELTQTPVASSTPTILPSARRNKHVSSAVKAALAGAARLHRAEQRATSSFTDCLPFRDGDGSDMYSNAQLMAGIEHNLGFILAGSGLGTLFFYGILYLVVRKKKI